MATTTGAPSKRPSRRRNNGSAGQRDAELAAMAARQAATLEILKTMSASPGDAQPVFELIARCGRELCNGYGVTVFEFDGGLIHWRAATGVSEDPTAREAAKARFPRPPAREFFIDRAILDGEVVHERDFQHLVPGVALRSVLAVPMMRGDTPIGGLALGSLEPGGFSDSQVELLKTFAEQAAIAIGSAETFRELQQRTAELAARNSAFSERIEQQAATIDVLKAMSAIASDTQPVFELITSRARELCGSLASMLFEFDGELLHLRAWGGYDREAAQDYLRQFPAPPSRGTAVGRTILERDIVHIRNIAEDPEIAPSVRTMGVRSTVGIPLLRNGQPIGVIAIGSTTTGGFSDSQIELLRTFAEQAVIAIGSAETFRALQQRTAELAARNSEYSERIDYQSATIDVLKAMSASPGDPQPVFDLIVRRARELCNAPSAGLMEYDGELIHFRALAGRETLGTPSAVEAYERLYPMVPTRASIVCRAVLDRQIVHIRDLGAESDVIQAARELGHKSVLALPLLSNGVAIGVIALNAMVTDGFSDTQVELLKTFAEQAVIAIRSAETFRELQQRTRDLSESLEQQIAATEVLQVINSSPGDLTPVFGAMINRARRLCSADFGSLSVFDGHAFVPFIAEGAAAARAEPISPEPGSALGQLVDGEDVVHFEDLTDTEAYRLGVPSRVRLVDLGARSAIWVALRKDDGLVGALVAWRKEVRAFSAKEISLLQNFASQAVIAIENARLLGELRTRTYDLEESLEYQTAISNVLKVISRSTFDLNPTLDTLVETAARLCAAEMGMIAKRDGNVYRTASTFAFSPEFRAVVQQLVFEPGRASVIGRAADARTVVQVEDLAADPDYGLPEVISVGKMRTALGVPLMREGDPIGILYLARQRVEPFTARQIELLRTFADQAVIAIENTRLLTEQHEALERQTATAEVLQVINASPGNLSPVFDAILEKAHSLCGATLGCLFLYDGTHIRGVATHGYPDDISAVLRQPNPPVPAVSSFLKGERFHHLRDVKEQTLAETNLVAKTIKELSDVRTNLVVPLRKDGTLLGMISANRTEVRPFTDSEITLLENFAAQAVIAMENARLLTEQREALEQQTATAEVLQVINASPGNLAPVFDAMLEKATRLCDAHSGFLWSYDGGRVQATAMRGLPHDFAEFVRRPMAVEPTTAIGQLARGEPLIHFEDITASSTYLAGDALPRATVELGGFRTVLVVPLRKDANLLGGFTIERQEVRPFSEKQIALLQNFAAQAVIAMENARLLTEQREALEHQTATAEVLKVINASPGNLAPVFEAILEKAHNLCGAAMGALTTFDGTHFRAIATRGYTAEHDAIIRQPFLPNVFHRALLDGERFSHTPDVRTGDFDRNEPITRSVLENTDLRTVLTVPLRKDGALLGFISAWRREVRPFSEKEIALLENFAAQAVIAMENARLLTEQREALEQQTATAEVLKVISRSAFNLQTVLDTLIESAVRLCNADRGHIHLRDGELFHVRAFAGTTLPEVVDYLRRTPIRASRKTAPGRAVLTGMAQNIADMSADPEMDQSVIDRGGLRSVLSVPLMRDGQVEGVISVIRPETVPFTPRQVELVTTFADQAVIAIENARLFDAVQSRTQELAQLVAELQALEEVLRAVNSSLELQTVLSTIISRAVPLAQADEGTIYEFDAAEEVFVPKAASGMSEERITRLRDRRIRIGETFLGRSAIERRPIHVADIQQDPSTPEAAALLPGIHAALAVPLLQGEKVIGGMVIRRRSEGAFAPNTVTLMQTFAGQSVLAIENARLFQDAERARAASESALNDLRRAQDRLIQSEKMASLGQLTAGIAHEIKNPLNFVNNFSALSAELIDELQGVLANAAVAGPTRAEVDELGAMIKGNLEKVVQHGKRADGIVRNMLLHARESGGERRSVDLNATIEEALTLAYHGARAEKPGFTITLEQKFDPGVGAVDIYPQEFTRVMLNLFANGFYAANRKAQDGAGPDFQPTLTVATAAGPEGVIVRVRDNGTGIPDSARARLFEPFFTTKPAGEGTGLGLSLSHDIVVKQHGGGIAVESEPGTFTEFTITLPRA